MQNNDFKTLINAIGNDLKISIDDLTGIIIDIKDDIEKLKNKKSDAKNLDKK